MLRGTFLFILFAVCVHSYAQPVPGAAVLTLADTGAYSIVERSDWRRYDNGRYTGLVRSEVRAFILPSATERSNSGSEGGLLYQGNFFVLQSTLRDMRLSARAVDSMIPVSFELFQDGTISIENDRGFPVMRGFPVFPSQAVTRGSKWRAPGNRAADPFHTEEPLIIPIFAEYEYRGTETYGGALVHRIYAAYASRYRSEIPGIHSIDRVQGSHKVDILIRAEDGRLVFMRDELDETYTMADGSTVRFAGFTLTFTQGVVPMNREDLITSLGTALHQDSSMDLKPVPEGIRLTIRNIHFVPDSAEFLPEERARLDLIAEALRQIPDRTFLVEGHTAAIGQPIEEKELSINRAKRMVDELVGRGIGAERFIYMGWGGTRPIGDNSTDSGRSQNRRVEITIME